MQDKINDTFNSLEGIQRATPPADLLEKAMARMYQGKARVVSMSPTYLWRAAACALVLLVANLFMCLDFVRIGKKQHNDKEMFVREYLNSSDGLQI